MGGVGGGGEGVLNFTTRLLNLHSSTWQLTVALQLSSGQILVMKILEFGDQQIYNFMQVKIKVLQLLCDLQYVLKLE